MELRHLRYYVAVAAVLNFREAAHQLRLSTPALSKQIKDLEAELGVRLLDRTTTRVRLTNAGEIFLAESRALLARAENAVLLAREAAQGQRGRLAIGNIGPLAANPLATTLSTFCTKYPEVTIDLIDMDVPAQLAALSSDEIQVGFIPDRYLPSLPRGLRHVSVLTTPLCAILGYENPLARQSAVSLADLAKERILCIGSARQSLHRNFLRTLFEGRGLRLRSMVDVKGFESLLAMIAGGQGVSLLAGRSGLTRVDHLVVRPLRETGDDIQVAVSAVWRDHDEALLARNFIETLRAPGRSATPSARTRRRPS